MRLGTVIVLVSSGKDYEILHICTATNTKKILMLRNTANLALWFVPEGAQSAWTLQETHRNSTSYARDEARTSERLLDRQMPYPDDLTSLP